MLYASSYIDNPIFLFSYMFIYNMSLVVFFWTILNYVSTNNKSLYSLNNFSFNPTTLFTLTVLLMSMAGVPPFIGFFSKLFVLTLVINYSFMTLYIFLFVILFFSLYFYIQNIRYLHSTNLKNSSSPQLINERLSINYVYVTVFSLTYIILGLFFIDDLILYFTWLFL